MRRPDRSIRGPSWMEGYRERRTDGSVFCGSPRPWHGGREDATGRLCAHRVGRRFVVGSRDQRVPRPHDPPGLLRQHHQVVSGRPAPFRDIRGANRTIGSIGQADLEQFLTWMRADRGVPCSPKSYARRLTTLKVFFGWLAESGAIPSDPAAPMVHQHPTTPLPEILYDTDAVTARCAPRDLLWAAKPDSRPVPVGHADAADGDQEERMHGDRAEAHRPLERGGAGALCALRGPAPDA